jgi:hypothetical protein
MGTQFEFFFGFFSDFLSSNGQKMTNFEFKTVKLEFKYNTWTNQKPPPSYRPPLQQWTIQTEAAPTRPVPPASNGP